MTSFVVGSTKKEKRQAYIKEFCRNLAIDIFDITLIEKETSVKQNTQSIGIEDIKLMQKKLFLKPIKSKTKAVILEDSQLLTTEAQNALLKVLEEPPEHTIIVLSTDTKEVLLPTILSRCKIIMLEEEKMALSPEETADYLGFIKSLPELTIGEKLKKAEVLAKDKEKAVAWIGKLLLVLREDILQKEAFESIGIVRSFQSLHTLLKTTNVNPRFAIEKTLLSLQ